MHNYDVNKNNTLLLHLLLSSMQNNALSATAVYLVLSGMIHASLPHIPTLRPASECMTPG